MLYHWAVYDNTSSNMSSLISLSLQDISPIRHHSIHRVVLLCTRFILPWKWLWLGDHNCVPKESCDLTGERYNVRVTDTFVDCAQVRFRSPSSLFTFNTIALTQNMLAPWMCAGDAMISKSFSFSHMLELPVVKGVIISQGLILTCDR